MSNATENLDGVKDQIQKDIQENEIVLYMKGSKEAPMCGFSGQVVHILKSLDADFVTRDILKDASLRQAIKEFSNWPTLPQLYIKGEFVGGCDIVTELYESGDLEKLLKPAA